MIAIHPRPGSFSDRWIQYCEEHTVPYKLVNCYDNDIIDQLRECKGLMWHWAHHDHKAVLFARQLTYSLEQAGIKVFPDSRTCWHFDDKVGQKYLLESLATPLVKTFVFYEKNTALEWSRSVRYPVVNKLRGGAGSENVKLVNSQSEASRIIRRAFGKGYKQKRRRYFLRERLWQFRRDRNFRSFLNLSKGLARLVIPTESEKQLPREKNYVYFQEFIPGSSFDIRVVVVGKRAFALKRGVREGDFRASGSGVKEYDPARIPIECVKTAFYLTTKLGGQSLAFDMIMCDNNASIIEMSYAFVTTTFPGFWDEKLEWISGECRVEDFVIKDFLNEIKEKACDAQK
ncbi:ATP-grasp domain-containing protein [Alkalispirochaeta alkalica]|uniref:ATP-grasp domain-containing protein n=1 Tax=Alkalispirochaeta alkalica TaxID=46356 RepID=UPI000373DF3A|nr:hypothetical protein [Alkalispirochaeta alkalica]